VRAVFTDFDNAFYHVDYNVLVGKLLAFGLPDTIIRRIAHFWQVDARESRSGSLAGTRNV